MSWSLPGQPVWTLPHSQFSKAPNSKHIFIPNTDLVICVKVLDPFFTQKKTTIESIHKPGRHNETMLKRKEREGGG